jgi:hypothetical protein
LVQKQALLITAYNRPKKLRALIDALRPIAPPLVFLHVDGPSPTKPNDERLVESTRALSREFDWRPQIVTHFQDGNLGCRQGMHYALDWFYSHVEMGAVLEDDLVPSGQALPFLHDGLERFRNSRVWLISANKQSSFRSFSRPSLTAIPHIWGWATWADRWNSHDKELDFWAEYRDSRRFASQFPTPAVAARFRDDIDRAHQGQIDTWDLGFMADMWANDGLCVSPPATLVSNRGFDAEGTHTVGPGWESSRPSYEVPRNKLTRSPKYSASAEIIELLMMKGGPRIRKALRRLSALLSAPAHAFFGFRKSLGVDRHR